MGAWSGFWDNEGDTTPHALLIDKSSLRKRMSLLMRQRGNAVLKELMLTLNGAAAGSTALATRTQVQAAQQLGLRGNGGAVTIETNDLVNRVTTSADKTDIDTVLQETRAPSSYPDDASGNGGGGKLGY